MQTARDIPLRDWASVVDELREKRGWSQDDLAYEARSHGAPRTLTGSNISQMRHGKRPLSLAALEGFAGALEISPENFIEYRLLTLRDALDERKIGLDVAAANLRAIEGAVAGGEDQAGSAEDRPLEQLLAATRSTLGDPAAAENSPGGESSPRGRRSKAA